MKWWALTITASNRSVPGGGTEDTDWFQLVCAYISQCHPINLTQEKGDDKNQDHLHVSVCIPMQDCKEHRKQLTDGLHGVLSMGSTPGKIPGKVSLSKS